MTRFLTKASLFAVTFIAAFLLLLKAIEISRSRIIRVPSDVHLAFFGNSQIESSVNDTIVLHSFNWARSGELPEFIYAKVKLLTQYNPQIDTIVIGFDNVLGFHADDEEFSYQLWHPFLYDMMDFSDWMTLVRQSPYDRWRNFFLYPLSWSKLRDLTRLSHPELTLRECRDLGGYKFLTRDKLAEHLARRKDKRHGRWHCSRNALYFLDRTIEYCRARHIQVLFLCAPQHPQILHDLQSYKEEHQDHYSDIPFYDLVNYELADSCFSDLNHLNYRGARIFSEYLNQQLNP